MSTASPIGFLLPALSLIALPLAAQQVPLRTPTVERQIRPQLQLAAAAPVGLQIAQSGSAVVLSWSPVAEQAAYRVYRAPDQSSFTELTPNPIPATNFPDSTAQAGATYYYRVAAQYSDGRTGMGDPMAFTVPAAPAKSTVTMANRAVTTAQRDAFVRPGQAPANLNAAPAPTSVKLSWSAQLGVNGFRIERNLSPGSAQWTPVGTVSDLFFTDNALDPDIPVQYRVTAEYADGRQGTSEPVSTRTTKPANPAQLRATVALQIINAQITPTWNASTVAFGNVALAWDPVPGAAYYEVSGTGLSNPRTVSAAGYTVAEVPPGPARYQVLAYFVNGTRRYGDAAHPATAEVFIGPQPVTDFKGSVLPQVQNRVDLMWTAPNNQALFKLLRADAEQGPYSEVSGSYPSAGGASDGTPHVQGKSYFYKVYTVFPSGPVAMTAPLRIDIPAAPVIANLTGISPGPHTVQLSWSPVPGAVEFAILKGYAPNGTMAWIERYGTTMKLQGYATGYSEVAGSGYTYKYSVCVWVSNGGSACSGAVSVPVPH